MYVVKDLVRMVTYRHTLEHILVINIINVMYVVTLGFSQNGHLQTHIRIHTGDKHYQCHVYGKGFSHNSSLQTHIKTHIGDKLYKCDICGQVFSENGNLQKNIRTHTGDKP